MLSFVPESADRGTSSALVYLALLGTIPSPCFYSLVLDLEVQVPTEPVIEQGLMNIAGCLELKEKKRSPGLIIILAMPHLKHRFLIPTGILAGHNSSRSYFQPI